MFLFQEKLCDGVATMEKELEAQSARHTTEANSLRDKNTKVANFQDLSVLTTSNLERCHFGTYVQYFVGYWTVLDGIPKQY